jgi:glutamine synthetase
MSDARRSRWESCCCPPTGLDAVRELERNDVRSAPPRDRDYAHVKRREWQATHEQITQLEMEHYLQLYQSGVGSQ